MLPLGVVGAFLSKVLFPQRGWRVWGNFLFEDPKAELPPLMDNEFFLGRKRIKLNFALHLLLLLNSDTFWLEKLLCCSLGVGFSCVIQP